MWVDKKTKPASNHDRKKGGNKVYGCCFFHNKMSTVPVTTQPLQYGTPTAFYSKLYILVERDKKDNSLKNV